MIRTEKIKIYLSLWMVAIFSMVFIGFEMEKSLDFIEISIFLMVLTTLIVALFTSLFIGFTASFIMILILLATVLLQNMDHEFILKRSYYVFTISIPIMAFIGGMLGKQINKNLFKQKGIEEKIHDLVRIDEETGLRNAKDFYELLEKEMDKSKRYGHDLSLLIIEIHYFKELLSIYGTEEIESLFIDLSKNLKEITRKADEKYRIDENIFAVVLPNTDNKGAQIVKKRIKERIEKDDPNLKKYNIRIGVKTYDDTVDHVVAYKKLAERELEYDI